MNTNHPPTAWPHRYKVGKFCFDQFVELVSAQSVRRTLRAGVHLELRHQHVNGRLHDKLQTRKPGSVVRTTLKSQHQQIRSSSSDMEALVTHIVPYRTVLYRTVLTSSGHSAGSSKLHQHQCPSSFCSPHVLRRLNIH